MRGLSLLLGNDVGASTTFPRKRTELNAINRKDEMTTRVEKAYNLRNGSRGGEIEEVNEIS